MKASKKSLHLAVGKSEDLRSRSELLVQCRTTAQKQLLELIRKLYDQLDDALFEFAQKAETNTLQSLYFDAMREIRLRRETFVASYTENFVGNYQSRCDCISNERVVSIKANKGAESELSLVESDDLEEQIAISSLVNKVQHHFSQPLSELAHRYAYLLNTTELQPEDLPLSPRAITDSFQSACTVFEVPLQVKLILYKLLDQHVMGSLQGMYNEVNNLLINKGVFPDAIPSLNTIKKTASSSPSPAVDTSFDQLCGLLNTGQAESGGAAHHGHGSIAGTPVGTTQYLSEDVIAALSQLQPKGGQGLPLDDSLLDALKHLPDMLPGSAIGTQERNAIELIEMIFDFIYEDKELSDHLKSTVARLQIPMLKVAILDKNFFSDKQHPSRELLNEFTQASIVDDSAKVEEKIETLVNRIVNEFSDDLSLFSDVLDDFREFMLKEQQAYLESQRKQLEEAERQEQRARDIKAVDDAIASCMPEHPMPDLLQAFMDEVWRELMINTYLDEGAESHGWNIHLQLTEDLLWSITPKVSAEERSYLASMIPHLVKMLGESLAQTSWDKQKISALFDELGDCHIGALRGEGATTETAIAAAVSQQHEPVEEITDPLHQHLLRELEDVEYEEIILDESGIHSQIKNAANESESDDEFFGMSGDLPILDDEVVDEESSVASSDYYDEQVAEMEVGDWVEFSDDGENLLKARLIWRGEVDRQLIFANWRHEIVRRCDEKELVTMLRNWDVRILNTVPIMERALSSVMSVLSDKSAVDGDRG